MIPLASVPFQTCCQRPASLQPLQEESVQLVSQWKTAKQLAPLQPQTPAVLAAAAAASAGVMSGEGTGVGAGPGTVATGREGAGKAAQRGPEEEAVFEAEA